MRSDYEHNAAIIKLAAVWLLILCGFQINIRAQDDLIRVDTELVLIPATVLDGNGKYVTSLTQADFRIVENGVEQDVALFETIGQPFTVLLLIDQSGSMIERNRTTNKAVNAFIKQLRPDDLIVIGTFGDKVADVLFQPVWAKDIKGDIDVADYSGKGRLRISNAPRHAIDLLTKKIGGRKAVVLFSDGIIQSEERPTADLLLAEAPNLIINTVQLDYTIDSNYTGENRKYLARLVEKADEFMRGLAEKSGGRHYKITGKAEVPKIFVEIADDLSHQYNLGYYPKSAAARQKSEIRRIRVETKQPNLTVRARESYVPRNP